MRIGFLPLVGVIAVVALSAPASSSAACVAPYCPSHTLTVQKTGNGSGTVTSSPVGIDCGSTCAAAYQEGTTVTLTAKAAAGSTFAGWSGGVCSGTGSCVLTIAADTTVTAKFKSGSPPLEGLVTVGPKAIVKRGKAALKLTCTGGGPCNGTLYLSARVKKGKKKKKNLVIAKSSFSLAAGVSTTLKVKLSRPAKRELKKHKRLKAKAFGPGVIGSKVKLKPAKKKHKRPS